MAVARALANDPPVILADEPTGSLDSKSSEQVFQILRDLVDQRGKTVVAVTHDLDLARRMDRRICARRTAASSPMRLESCNTRRRIRDDVRCRSRGRRRTQTASRFLALATVYRSDACEFANGEG